MHKCLSLFLAGVSLVGFAAAPSLAQSREEADRINHWFDDINKRYPNLNKSQQPGKIQVPGKIQTPGKIQAPSGIKAIKSTSGPCSERFTVGSDTLFEFDQSILTANAEETLKALAPMISKLGAHPVTVEGHTDGIGSDEYNQNLSEKRAQRVKNWLLEHHILTPNTVTTVGYGKKHPIAPNTKSDGSDNPEGRALNRRVEISVDTCKNTDTPPAGPANQPATAVPTGDSPVAGAPAAAGPAGGSPTATPPPADQTAGPTESNRSDSPTQP